LTQAVGNPKLAEPITSKELLETKPICAFGSPIDRVLFRIVDALRSVETAGAKRPAAAHGRVARTKTLKATPYQHSVIRGALSSGLKPREVAKLLKVPIVRVQAVAKDE